MDFTKLEVWREARKLTNMIYTITKNFPKSELFGLSNQMQRAGISVPSNIAEGCGRSTAADTIRFFHIARGSLFEIETQCYLALDQNYMTQPDFEKLIQQLQTNKRLLNGFINYYKNKQL